MKKSRIVIALSTFALVAAVFAFGGFTAQAGTNDDGPKAPITLKNKKGAVTFKHEIHKSQSCKTCHHKEKDGKIGVACSECHKAKVENDVPKAKKAFHDKCIACHKKEKKGPSKCKECHVK